MPWHIAKSAKCPDAKPWAVIKDADGSVAGCHATKDAANAQLAALYASEGTMSKRRETRRVEIRAAEVDGRPGVTLHAITPDVVDDFGSVWMADAFDESLATRLPTLCWAHDWSEPLGPGAGFRTTPNGPEIDFTFSDFDAVPMARRAHTQVTDGTIRDCSVGFANTQRRDPTKDEQKRWPGVREVIEKADLDEVSLVLRGAVPGAKVLAVRSGCTVDVDAVVEIARRKVAGELTEDEAKAAVELLGEAPEATERPLQSPDSAETGESGQEPPGNDTAALEAELDEALEAIGRSRR